jgi:3-phenylpropionate/trans-cinnamate dioxygenase ferredoxin reductase subunit
VVVESVNRAGDHAAAKRIIGTAKALTPEDAANPAFDLRASAKR